MPLWAESTAWVLLPPTGRDVPTTWPTDFFQWLCARTVLHGQIHTYLGNIHIGHDAAHRELLGVGQGRG